jgi:predicted transcriptional regulator
MTKKAEQTEVVKIRLGSEDKVRLQEIAEKECRTFSDQCRLAIREWLKTKSARPGREAAANIKETASTAYNSRKPK